MFLFFFNLSLVRNVDDLNKINLDHFVNHLASVDAFLRFFFSHERPAKYISSLRCCLDAKFD